MAAPPPGGKGNKYLSEERLKRICQPNYRDVWFFRVLYIDECGPPGSAYLLRLSEQSPGNFVSPPPRPSPCPGNARK